MKVFFFPLFLFLSTNLVAQQLEYAYYDWVKTPKPYVKTNLDTAISSVQVKDLRVHELAFDVNNKIFRYVTYHQIVYIAKEKAVEENNKIYIPLAEGDELLDIKARFISASGKVTEVNESNIKELENIDNYGAFKIFAMEGVELGGVVEYLYTAKRGIKEYGTDYYQSDDPLEYGRFEYITPEHVEFEFKSFGGFPEGKDTVRDGKRYFVADSIKAEALFEEPFANYNASRMSIQYRLSFIHGNSKAKLNSWSDAGRRYYLYLQDPNAAKQVKMITKEYAEALKGKTTEEEKIIAIENHTKNSFGFEEQVSFALQDIPSIFKNRKASATGMMKLFMQALDAYKINYQIVLTCDRNSRLFHADFENWDYLEEFLIFFPSTGQYMSPYEYQFRYPLVPYQYRNNYGLFIKLMDVGGVVSPVSKVQFIEPMSDEEHFHNHDLTVRFESDMSKALIGMKQYFGGYKAVYYQPYWHLIEPVKQTELIHTFAKTSAEDATIISSSAENTDDKISPFYKPMIINAEMSSEGIIEQAGTKFIFKIGELIGEQAELYQDRERKLPVENEFNRQYIRNITVTIPEGYKVSGLESLKMNVVMGGKYPNSSAFISSYELKGNVLTIHIDEYYKKLNYELSEFASYREVINAAADFNKITLVFEPL
jgi:hypothetical protein